MGRPATVILGPDGQPLGPEERKRELARLRKEAQRKREEEAANAEPEGLAALGKEYNFLAYPATVEALDLICQTDGFEDWEELFTLIAHNVAAQIKRDCHDYRALLAFPSREKGGAE
jgi:hypothetical protein